ncbi:hypothetical protein [Andreprevotia chitinilytica]|uniref:hypothetical protein n=1 Tax=Andreprevotia chitinilytica TaxID=396808 RepID=UPI000551E920|nr:hypothetical protein [Andreprevotia chitinilytica]
MRSGSHHRRLSLQRGLAYLGVLMIAFMVGLGTMQAARVWGKIRQREQETQLLFVGDQYRNAIEHYYKSAEGSRYPESLEDLLADKRVPYTLRHLRRLYDDPLTGKAEWGLVKAPDGRIMGVYSQAPGTPQKQGGFPDRYQAFAGKSSYQDWTFVYKPPEAQTAQPQ